MCTNCGQCVNRCPTGALVEKTYIDQVWDAIYDPEKHVVVQTAPAVRVALGEDLGYDPGERVTGKMVTALVNWVSIPFLIPISVLTLPSWKKELNFSQG